MNSNLSNTASILHQFVADVCYLFQETAEIYVYDYPEFYTVVNEAKRQLGQLYKRLMLANGIYRIAFVGLGNVGKSTLLNALLGKNIAMSWNGPCTSFPIEIQKAFDNKLDLMIMRQNKALIKEHITYDTEDELQDKLKDLLYDSDLQKVQIRLNSALLSDQVILVDTPGFGAIQTEPHNRLHEDSVKGYLHSHVSQIFWVVTGANGGIGKREKEFYSELLADCCDDLIVTRTEDWDDNDKSRFVKRYRKELANPFAKFFFVSATHGLAARQSGDEQLLLQAGIQQLETRIRSLADPFNRFEQIKRSIIELFSNLVLHIHEEIPPNSYCRAAWHPTEWKKLKVKYANSDLQFSFLQKLAF